MRQVLLRDGRLAWVNDEGQIVRISSGMGGAEPGFGETSQSNLPPPNVYHPDARTRDIMSRLPDADVVGLRGPGVVPGGEQAAGGRRVERADAGLPPAGATYRPLAGAQVNNRGGIQTVLVPSAVPVPTQIIPSVVETPKSGGIDAETITIQLSLDLPFAMKDPTSTAAGIPIDVVAVVEWGVGGAFFTAEVDWVQGTVIGLCASFVRVSAKVTGTQVALPGVPDASIVLRASLAYGGGNSFGISCPARRTIPLLDAGGNNLIAAGQLSEPVAIPAWAIGFTLSDGGVLAGLVSVPDYTIYVLPRIGGLVAEAIYGVVSRTNLSTQVEGQFPITVNNRFIQVRNNLGTGVIAPKLIFNLGL